MKDISPSHRFVEDVLEGDVNQVDFNDEPDDARPRPQLDKRITLTTRLQADGIRRPSRS